MAFVTSCKHSLYVPNVSNVPAFSGNRQLQAAVFPGLDHVEVQAAANPYRHVGIMSNNYVGTNVFFFEGGVGGLLPKEKYTIELFTGYGSGSVLRDFTKGGSLTGYFTKTHLESRYSRFFIQPDISFRNDHLTLILSVRGNWLLFHKYIYNYEKHTYYTPTTIYLSETSSYSNDQKISITLEPAVTLKGDLKYFDLFLQVLSVYPLSQEDKSNNSITYNQFLHQNYQLNIGIQFSLLLDNKKQAAGAKD